MSKMDDIYHKTDVAQYIVDRFNKLSSNLGNPNIQSLSQHERCQQYVEWLRMAIGLHQLGLLTNDELYSINNPSHFVIEDLDLTQKAPGE